MKKKLEYKMFDFQENTLSCIACKLKTKSLIILEGPVGSGKTTLAKKIKLEGYEDCYISGSVTSQSVSLAPFKKTKIVAKMKRNKAKLETPAKIVASFIPAVGSGIKEMITSLEVFSNPDAVYILKKLENRMNKFLLIVDETDYLDYHSISLLNYLIDKYNEFENLKILIIRDSNDSSTALNISNFFKINVSSVGERDLEELKIEKNQTKEGLTNFPIKVLLHYSENRRKDTVVQYVNSSFFEKYKKISNRDEILLLKLISLHRKLQDREWIDLEILSQYLVQKRVFDTKNILKKITELDLVILDDSKKFVRFNDMYLDLLDKELVREDIKEELFIYLNFLETKAPFQYLEKFQCYSFIGNNELAIKNAFLSYFQMMVEQGESKTTISLLEYLNQSDLKDLTQVVEHTLKFYTNNEYQSAFHETDSFLEKLQGRFYAFPIEIIAELSCIRALSLARIINRSDQSTRSIEARDIQFLENLLPKLSHTEIALRIQESILILKNDQRPAQSEEEIENIFCKIFDQYNIQIKKSLPKYVDFWQRKQAKFLSKVEMVNINMENKLSIIRRSYQICKSFQNNYPISFIKVSNNYAGALFRQGEYKYATDVLEEAINFIESKSLDINWGVIYQMRLIYKTFSDCFNDEIFESFNDLIWFQEDARKRMHEGFICISNYSLLLLCSKNRDEATIKRAREYLKKALENAPSDPFDEYLLKTNLGAIFYLNNQKKYAIKMEKECKKLIDQGTIKYLDLTSLSRRHTKLIFIYEGKDTKQSVMDCIDKESSYNKHYFRLGMFSDISYWSD